MTDLNKGKIPTSFETDRLCVRRYVLDDDELLYRAARESVKDVFPFLTWCHPDYDISETRQWLSTIEPEWRAARSYSFALTEKSGEKLLGGIGLNSIDEHPVANLGYWVRSSAAGQGLATEATIGLAKFGFTNLGLIRIEIVMSVENKASRRVATKAGATHEGILRNRLLLHGRCHHAHCYSFTRSDAGIL